METEKPFKYVVIGGGIAAVCCVEQLADLDSESRIGLISASKIVKTVSNVQKIGLEMESFDVAESSGESVFSKLKNVQLIFGFCNNVCSKEKVLHLKDGRRFKYDKLCIATGGTPKLVSTNPYVIGIRDTETVKEFQKKLTNARRIAIVGNGGIATELIYEVDNVEVIWLVKHKSISATFVDAGAAEFFISHLNDKKSKPGVSKRLKYTHVENSPSTTSGESSVKGSALGPDWVEGLDVKGIAEGRRVHIEFESEVETILVPKDVSNCTELPENFSKSITDWPVYIKLVNSKTFGCDLIVSATGVEPNCPIKISDDQFVFASDGGILVNDNMQSSVKDVYAAGDVCTAGWNWSAHWIQMRLWTQARQMGAYAGRCMFQNAKNNSMELDMCFELFTHVTNFFGFKVILLGKFNSQGLRPDHEAFLRVKRDEEYVKILVQDGKVQGAILIGETDLEETFENLILNAIDVSHLGEDLLNPTVDIEDYFD